MTDLPPLHARLYESTPEEIAEALRYLAMADAVAVALTRQPVAGDGMKIGGWRVMDDVACVLSLHHLKTEAEAEAAKLPAPRIEPMWVGRKATFDPSAMIAAAPTDTPADGEAASA